MMVEFVSTPPSSRNPGFNIFEQLSFPAVRAFEFVNATAIHLAAPVVILGMLALALIRKGQLVTLDVCPAYESALMSVGLSAETFRAADPGRAALLDSTLYNLLSQVFPRIDEAKSIHLVSPYLWRPSLSLLVWFFLVSWFVFTMLGYLYWTLALGGTVALRREEAEAASAEAVAPEAPTAGKRAGGKAAKAKRA